MVNRQRPAFPRPLAIGQVQMRHPYAEGDIFVCSEGGREALGQIVCAPRERFANAFRFRAVPTGTHESGAPGATYWAASSNLVRGRWRIIDHLDIEADAVEFFVTYAVSNDLYRRDEYIRKLTSEELSGIPQLRVAGNILALRRLTGESNW